MNKPLLPLTKLVLGVSATVQVVFALIALIAPNASQPFLSPNPTEPVPVLWMRFDAALYLAMALGAVYALSQNRWTAGRIYLAIAGMYVLLGTLLNILAIFTSPGSPAIVWLYLALSIIYLPLVAWIWKQESSQTELA